VKDANKIAIKLYRKFGYELRPDEEKGFLIGSAKA